MFRAGERRVVLLAGVEAAGFGVDTPQHAATLTKGSPGVLHGSLSYLIQNEDGQIVDPHSISAGLDYPGVNPFYTMVAFSSKTSSCYLISLINPLRTGVACAWVNQGPQSTSTGVSRQCKRFPY